MRYLLIASLILFLGFSGCGRNSVSEESRAAPEKRAVTSEKESGRDKISDEGASLSGEDYSAAESGASGAEAQNPPPPEYETVSESFTPLLDKSPERLNNINIACGAINGVALYPGGSFSFNEVVGQRTRERGFADAAVIVDGHADTGCGGGICQVSSTLYMSAVKAGLRIDERHPHSHTVPYAPDGNDATVVFGHLDLRFTNNTDSILILCVQVEEDGVFSGIIKKNS